MTENAPVENIETLKAEFDSFKNQAAETNASLRKEIETLTAQLKGARDANAMLATQIPSAPAPQNMRSPLEEALDVVGKIADIKFNECLEKNKVKS